ncbi:MAG: phospholipase A [Desulfobacteraceae bacterium]|nr:phospholipase A [Desulfobacteraceae bacterium]
MPYFETGPKRFVPILVFTFFMLCLPTGDLWAGLQKNLRGCAAIEDETLRLQCYDELAGRNKPKGDITVQTASVPPPESHKASPLSDLWELDKSRSRSRFTIKMHRSNYIMPFTYNRSPNNKPIHEVDPDTDVYESEVAFQLSIKSKLWEGILGKDLDLWVGYTQRSFWQLYNTDSAPFRETNYEPELLLNLPMSIDLPGMTLRTVNFGINHQSNGRGEPLSRSWNRLVANFGFEKENAFSGGDTLVLQLKSWWRIPESSSDDDNPDIEDYLGNGEIRGYYLWEGQRFGMMVRNNLDFNDNRGAFQVEWTYPLNERVSWYLQYYTGYGESLLDYDHTVNRLGIGFILTDWN